MAGLASGEQTLPLQPRAPSAAGAEGSAIVEAAEQVKKAWQSKDYIMTLKKIDWRGQDDYMGL